MKNFIENYLGDNAVIVGLVLGSVLVLVWRLL